MRVSVAPRTARKSALKATRSCWEQVDALTCPARTKRGYRGHGMARYFSATAMGGKLYPEGLSEARGWNPEALVFYSEDVARMMASPYTQDSLVFVAEDLRRIVRASALPAVKVWIHENLEGVARNIWEESNASSEEPLTKR